MPTVAAMLIGTAARQLASEQMGTSVKARYCESTDALLRLVAGGGLDAVVADLWDGSGASVLPAIGAIRRGAPTLPVILYFLPTPAALREIPQVIAASRGVHVVLRNYEHLGLALRPLLRPPRVPSAAETLARHVVPLVPPSFQSFFLVCALKASPRLRVGTAAAWSGFSRRTLERSLRPARLPSAAVTLGSCTALHAAWWIDVQGWSAKQVVAEMRFSHASALTRVLQRYFDCSIRTLSEVGGFQELLYRFETTLLGGRISPSRL